MSNESYLLDVFLSKLRKCGERKASLYDGMNNQHSIDHALRLATEELGEVASAVTRDRYLLAVEESIDLAHTAFLLFMALLRETEGEKRE